MRSSLRKGFSFGLTSGIITTLGLIVGLQAGTHSRLAVIGGILAIAVADAMSDALGIHISEESEDKHPAREIWESTAATLASKFVFATSFLLPVLFLPLAEAVAACVLWGLSLIALFSYHLAKQEGLKPHRVIFEHLTIAILVIIATQYVGGWISAIT
jgi:VIT1/CCC1 family predicted Fe2+/Mn2+ transporter